MWMNPYNPEDIPVSLTRNVMDQTEGFTMGFILRMDPYPMNLGYAYREK